MPCNKCRGYDAATHETEDHTEDWVNLADARYTGEVILVRNATWQSVIDIMWPGETPGAIHVGRTIVQTMLNVLAERAEVGDIDDAEMVLLNELSNMLADNPVRPDPDEVDWSMYRNDLQGATVIEVPGLYDNSTDATDGKG